MSSAFLHKVLTATLFGLWVVCFGLTLYDVVRPSAYPPFVVDPARSGEAPRLTDFVAGIAVPDVPLERGDRVLAAGGRSLEGGGAVALASAFARHRADAPVAIRFERAGEAGTVSVTPGSHRRYWPRLLASAAFALCALLLWRRGRAGVLTRALVTTNLLAALFFACTFAGGLLETQLSVAVHVLSLAAAAPLGLRVVQLFPHEQAPRGLARWLPLPFAALALFDASRFYGFPLSRELGSVLANGLGLLYIAIGFACLRTSWRRSDALGRRQLKWMLLGGYLALLPIAAAVVLTLARPAYGSLLAVAIASLGIFPIFWLIGIVRFNWFDIDRLLSSTASYSLLLVAALMAVIAGAPALAAMVSRAAEIEPVLAQGLIALGLAAVLIPAHRRLRPLLERWFFGDRFAFEQGLEPLVGALASCDSAEALLQVTGDGVDRLLQPGACLVYQRVEQRFEPAFARGRHAPPPIEVRSALAAALEEQKDPVAREGAEIRDDPTLGSFQRAILDSLAAPVVVPIRRGDALEAFLVLGEKRSGDVYTRTERALLAVVADRVGSQLLHIDQSRAIRESRDQQERLRRYVPDNLADQLDAGEELDLGELEVTVLFADLRDYSRHAEPLAPHEVFSVVNRYTEAVSAAVREAGGTVVEFAGDGVMAVFGAPRPVAAKERAAVEAALRIVDAVAALEAPGGAPLSVGAGVATGPAFVGSVRAVDRLIWTALGNTTNLASRLQQLTRELDAAVVVDAATHAAAGAAGAGFSAQAPRRIRGREAAEALFVLPRRG